MPDPQQKPAAPQPAAHEPELVSVTRTEILQALKSPYATPAAIQELGAALQLTAQQIGQLTAGGADLQMTAEQHASLRTRLASAYAEAGKGKANDDQKGQNDQAGSLCGSSGSPAPTAAKNAVPAVTTTSTGVTETDAGHQLTQDKVGSGTVTVRRDVTASGIGPNLFAIDYKGADAKDAHWLQFIHREIIGIHADGSAHPLVDSWATNSHSYKLTQGGTASAYGTPKEENYNTDAGTSGADPFYETVGAANRGADNTQVYDRPSNGNPKVGAAFGAGAKRVISRAHFDTFLVMKDHVAFRVKLSMIYDFPSAAATPSPTTVSDGSGACANLPDDIAARFHSDWPAYKWLK